MYKSKLYLHLNILSYNDKDCLNLFIRDLGKLKYFQDYDFCNYIVKRSWFLYCNFYFKYINLDFLKLLFNFNFNSCTYKV